MKEKKMSLNVQKGQNKPQRFCQEHLSIFTVVLKGFRKTYKYLIILIFRVSNISHLENINIQLIKYSDL